MRNSTSIPVIKLSDKLSIGPQPMLADFALLAAEGYDTVINNRPGFEDAMQPSPEAEAQAAQSAGMVYKFIPITLANITEADVRAFQDAVAGTDGSVLAHCKSGLRSATLHVIGEVLDGRLAQNEIPKMADYWQLNLSEATRWLDQHSQRTPHVHGFYDNRTGSVQYVIVDPSTLHCAVIDPVLDFDEKSGSTATVSADAILAFIADEGLFLEWILETHPHADHFSAAQYMKRRSGALVATSARVVEVQRLWQSIYNLPQLLTDGSQWDRLWLDDEVFTIGSLDVTVLSSPGHTPASVTYLAGDAAFVHDTLFMPDSGTARADFPGGDAGQLWDSIAAILKLPDATRLFTGHDYPPDGRSPRWETTVAEQKTRNVHVAGSDRAQFIARREGRDRTLPMPKLLLPALQINIAAGHLPEQEANGRSYLKIPLNTFPGVAW
ncbi:bifunctional sulfur transferase/dioxygenase Blh [Duganella aquatilis]|uniref:bifunctional sulfur transferase/dioxygenase Blh n=1 Tax=Duganella aquatilis TaxID=2666082 RepID=UPI001AA04BA9